MTVPSHIGAVLTLLIALGSFSTGRQLTSQSFPRYKTVISVFDNIIMAVGDERPAPKLSIWLEANPEGYTVAWCLFDATTGGIGIDESAVKLCLEFGRDSLNALAVLLGHELAHFYRADTIAHDFSKAFVSAPLYGSIKDRASREQHMAIETDADLFGGLYGYLAGYNTLGVNARVLDRIYTRFGIPDTLPGYLNLGERQAIARSTGDSLRKLIPIVDAGTFLFTLGKYAESARCFDLIAQKFPSREMFNNAGVARALEAIRISEPRALPFPYPLEFDVNMRLRSLTRGRGRGPVTEAEEKKANYRSKLLLAAEENFKQAQKRDPGYPTALVNHACVVDLLGADEQAIAKATEAIALAKKNNDTISFRHAYQVRCIAYRGKGDTSRANADAKMVGRYHERVRDAEVRADGQEAVDGSRGSSFTIDRSQLAALVQADAEGGSPIGVYSQELDNSRAVLAEWSGKEVLAIETMPNYPLESNRGIRVGSRRAEVEGRYGSPTSVCATSRGECLVFNIARIGFWIGTDDRVQGWMMTTLKNDEYAIDRRLVCPTSFEVNVRFSIRSILPSGRRNLVIPPIGQRP